MRQYIETHIAIALTLIVLAVSAGIGAFVADRNQKEAERSVRTLLDGQEARMLALAEITDRNGADESAAPIIKDCERRSEFDSLLGSLGSLGKKDLLTTQSLFEACGNFERERKALTVGKLERELEMYRDLLALLRTFTEDDLGGYHEVQWEDIVEHEKLRSALLSDLTDIQGEIIAELIRGSSVGGKTVSTLVAEAQNIGQRLIVYDRTIDEARKSISE